MTLLIADSSSCVSNPVKKTGVFVNASQEYIVSKITQYDLDAVQLHGDESEAMLKELYGIGFKAIRPMNMAQALDDVNYFKSQFPTDERWPSLLLDAYHPNLYGGTGEQVSTDVALAVKAQVPRLMLAGGLTPENVGGRVQAIQPWGVDTASGVEVEGQAGIKDAAKIKAFVVAVRQS